MNKIFVAKQLAKQNALQIQSKNYKIEYENTQIPNQNKTDIIQSGSGSDINPINIPIIKSNNLINNITSGPYSYKLFFEGKWYPHSVNLTKLYFKFSHNNKEHNKILYLSTGHSFAEGKYLTEKDVEITKTSNISDIFTQTNKNIFFSIDNGFDDICLINFGLLDIPRDNYLPFKNNNYQVKSVCQNMDINLMVKELLLKNGHNTGESYSKAVINFETDKYLVSKHNKNTYHTFKIKKDDLNNYQIIMVSSKFSSGIIVKGIDGSISKYNNEIINQAKSDELLEYYFAGVLKEFKYHDLLHNIEIDDNLKKYWINYSKAKCLSVVSLMGDSGSGFFKVDDNNLEFVGINIGSCPIIILSEYNKNINSKKLFWDEELGKLCFGKYIIEEIHRGSQILPINKIQELINHNLPANIQVKEILV